MSKVQIDNIQVEDKDGGAVSITVTIPAKQVQKTTTQVIKRYSRQVKLKGFRPGHAPAGIVRRTVGDERIIQDVQDDLVQSAFQDALTQKDLTPLVQAQITKIDLDVFDTSKNLQFTAETILRPEITLSDPTALTATRHVEEVSEEAVDGQLEELRQQSPSFEDVEGRGAQDGDVAIGTLEANIEGVDKTAEPERVQPFRVGESKTTPPLDEHVAGLKVDEERTFEAQYPDDYDDEELAGKTGTFTFKLTALKENKLPELNDEFAQKLGLENMEDVRTRVREQLQEQNNLKARDDVRDVILDQFVAQAQMEIPTSMVERMVKERIELKEAEYKKDEKTLDDYLTESEQTREQWEEKLREDQTASLKDNLVVSQVASEQKITVPQRELEDYFIRLAQSIGQPVEQLVQQLDVRAVNDSILRQKAVDWLVEQAQVEDEGAAEKEPETVESA